MNSVEKPNNLTKQVISMHDKYIVYFVSKTKTFMTQFIEQQLKASSLNDIIPSHGNILTVLYEADGLLTMKDIAKKIGKDKSTVTALVNKLVTLGYVTKETATHDRRITHVKLTEKAIKAQPTYDSISQAVHETAYQNFTEAEKKELLRLLKKLSLNFKNKI